MLTDNDTGLEGVHQTAETAAPSRPYTPENQQEVAGEIRRTSSGSIDTEYYMKRSRKLRSNNFLRFFKGMLL